MELEIKEDQLCWRNKLPLHTINVPYNPSIYFTTLRTQVTNKKRHIEKDIDKEVCVTDETNQNLTPTQN